MYSVVVWPGAISSRSDGSDRLSRPASPDGADCRVRQADCRVEASAREQGYRSYDSVYTSHCSRLHCPGVVSSSRVFSSKNVGPVAVRQTSSTNLPACCWNLVPVRCLLCQVAKVGRIAPSICPFCSLQLDIRHEQHSCPNRARQGQP